MAARALPRSQKPPRRASRAGSPGCESCNSACATRSSCARKDASSIGSPPKAIVYGTSGRHPSSWLSGPAKVWVSPLASGPAWVQVFQLGRVRPGSSLPPRYPGPAQVQPPPLFPGSGPGPGNIFPTVFLVWTLVAASSCFLLFGTNATAPVRNRTRRMS